MTNRDIEGLSDESRGLLGAGRRIVAVIGVDKYQHWPRLQNAVSDANGARSLFLRLGFDELTKPLLDANASRDAIWSLVTDDLMELGLDDSLVLFYAGHGGTRVRQIGEKQIKTGYLIPADAENTAKKFATWIDLEAWLREVAKLPSRHILVILDACHSGIALGPLIKWRDGGQWENTSLAALAARPSRRIITSALDDQLALDSGPVDGHSLFTGCLIEALTGGIRQDRLAVVSGSELGHYLQRRVATYPDSRQTPDFGAFDFDERGAMLIPLLLTDRVEPVPDHPSPQTTVPDLTLDDPAKGSVDASERATALSTAQNPIDPPHKSIVELDTFATPSTAEARPTQDDEQSNGGNRRLEVKRGLGSTPLFVRLLLFGSVAIVISLVAYKNCGETASKDSVALVPSSDSNSGSGVVEPASPETGTVSSTSAVTEIVDAPLEIVDARTTDAPGVRSFVYVSPTAPRITVPLVSGPFCAYTPSIDGPWWASYLDLRSKCYPTRDECARSGSQSACDEITELWCDVEWFRADGKTHTTYVHCYKDKAPCEENRKREIQDLREGRGTGAEARSDRCYQVSLRRP